MRLHSDTLTEADIRSACALARENGYDVYVEGMVRTGSRSRRNGYTLYLESANGRRTTNRRGKSDSRAATWSAWGFVIAELFNRDPEAIVGQYDSPQDFHRQCESMGDWRKKLDGPNALDFLEHLTS